MEIPRFLVYRRSNLLLSLASLASIPRHTAFAFHARKVAPKPASSLPTTRIRTMMSAKLETAPTVEHLPKDILPDWMLEGRTKILAGSAESFKPVAQEKETVGTKTSRVAYLMQRDVRTKDNWALLLAAHFAQQRQVPLCVVYALPPPPSQQTKKEDDNEGDTIPELKDLPMTERHGKFLLGGLRCVHAELAARKIPLHVLMPSSHQVVGETIWKHGVQKHNIDLLVTDFSPLRHCREHLELQLVPLLNDHNVPCVQVDTHNIVPVWIASDKREYGARTIRPKIQRLLDSYLTNFHRFKNIDLSAHNNDATEIPDFQQTLYEDFLQMDSTVPTLDWAKPGTEAALTKAEFFFKNGLSKFDKLRNDPNQRSICSNLSPWLNHGHVSFQRLALGVKKLNAYPDGAKAFLEEGIIRRELSDNYLYYTPNDYDSLSSAYEWAQDTLRVHASDKREYIYTLQQFEDGETHDDLWNAAQLQAVRYGKMHGFLRMYWAKKILEWTESPEQALKTAQYLNDKFNIDGRDPNGFVGVGWSIMGLHDQGWKEREVFGKIRFMNYAGCKRKFKVPEFVAKYKGASENAMMATNTTVSTKRTASKSGDGKAKKKQKA